MSAPAGGVGSKSGMRVPGFATACRNMAATVRDHVRPLGWAGALGLACLVAAAVLWWGPIRGSQAAIREMRGELIQLRERSKSSPRSPRVPDSAEQLRAFQAFFPPRGQINMALRDFDKLAAEHRLVLANGDYKYSEEKNLRLARYELRLPVRGPYPQVYGLVAAALNAMPNLALDEIVVKRASRQAGDVEAQLRFSLYVSQN